MTRSDEITFQINFFAHIFIYCLFSGAIIPRIISNGNGKMIVEFFSDAMLFNVCKYRSCNAAGLLQIISDACFNASDDFISPSAAITFALASRLASASVAMALCSAVGRLTSFLLTKVEYIANESNRIC